MRRENQGERSRVNLILNPGHDRFTPEDINALLSHLQRAPTLLHHQFAPVLLQLKRDYPTHPKLLAFLEQHPPSSRAKLISQHQHLIHNFTDIMQRKAVTDHIDTLSQRAQAESKALSSSRPVQQQSIPSPSEFQFDKIQLLYPQYESYYKMSKQQKSHLMQYHPKPKTKDFFNEPRFIVRIQQFQHFRSNEQRKGDILYLQYQGNTIAIGKAQLVGNKKALEMWGWEDDNYPLPVLTIPNQEEQEEKKKDQKKEEKKEENSPPPNNAAAKIQFVHKFVGHSEKITEIGVSQDQYYAITGSADKTIRLWCLRLKICLALYRGHTKAVLDVSFSPSGYYFLSSGSDGMAFLWKTDQPHAQRIFYHQAPVYKVQFAKDPSHVITAGEDACIKIWSISDGLLLRSIRLNEPVVNFNLGFSGAFIVAVEADGRVNLLDLLKGTIVNSFYFHQPQRRRKDDDSARPKVLQIHEACLSEDQRELACVCSRFVLIYSMDKLQKKASSNIFTLYSNQQENDSTVILDPKEVLYLSGDNNLTHCSYQSKNMLVVAGTYKQ